MTLNSLYQEAARLRQHLLYLEADDRAYLHGLGPEIERTRRALYETKVKINSKEFA